MRRHRELSLTHQGLRLDITLRVEGPFSERTLTWFVDMFGLALERLLAQFEVKDMHISVRRHG